jgi:ribonuclease PH
MDAGISMSDMFVACSVGFVKQQLCIDLNYTEQNNGGAYLPIVIKSQSEEILYIQLDSRLDVDKLDEAMQQCVLGCRSLKVYLESAIRNKMVQDLQYGKS